MELDHEITILAADPVAQRLRQLRGVGPMVATDLFATVGDATQFANGQPMASSLGLTPKQNSSGAGFSWLMQKLPQIMRQHLT